ncbi:MAG: M23 family metallopeptidase [Xenococcaceae cyanobacterium]
MSIRFCLKSLCFLLGILLTIFIHIVSYIGIGYSQELFDQHDTHYHVNPVGDLPTFTVEQNGLTAEYPDWQKLTFSRLGSIAEGGELLSRPDWDRAVGYELSRIWSAGDSPAEFLKLGDFQDSKVGDLTLDYILNLSLTEIDEVPLSAFGLIREQTISSLVEAIPELGELKVFEVEPILELVGSDYANVEIGRLIDTTLGDLGFDELNLDDFSLSSIPFVNETPLSEFKDWQNSFLEQVPGLWDLPLNFIFGDGIFANGLIGIVDIAFGTAEAGIDNTISGSYEEGFNVPCETECAHVELAKWAKGKRWISGKYQKVKGGEGLLGLVNGGVEPTGRHPFGSAFKVVVWETSEPEGRVDTALFFRYCQRGWFVDLGCTPYFIGPVPFLSYNEKDTMFIGLLDGSGGGSGSGSSRTPPIPVPPIEEPIPPTTGIDLIDPLPGAVVTSEYGYRNTGIPGASTFHTGLDKAYAYNDPRYPGQIIAAGDGVVAYAGRDNSGCGTLIWIDHPNGLRTGYCHMSEIYVKRRQRVSQGQVIALVGNEGVGSGPHLHFMIYENRTKKVNPRKYVNF